MRKIDKLVLSAFWGPFVLTTLVVIFIFLLRLVLFYFADLFGKDLGTFVYVELFFYFSLITLPLALPLSVLLSSLMTFGKLGENFELTALKSAGISIFRVLRPLFIVAACLSLFMFWFNNIAMPWANLKGWSLLYDIKTTKTTLNIKEGIFYADLPGYSIQVAKKYPDNKTLKGLVIYDHSHNDGNRHVTLADSAQMYTILGKKYLIFELFNGKDYVEDADRGTNLDATDMAVHVFKRSKIVMSLEAFDMHKTEENQFSQNEIMRNNMQLAHDKDSLTAVLRNIKIGFIHAAGPNFMYFHKPIKSSLILLRNTKWVAARIKKGMKHQSRPVLDIVDQQILNMNTMAQSNLIAINDRTEKLKKTQIEWHHKFTNSFAILVMFLIGAPLGAIIKKGGFGIPVVVAVSFFILMYILTQQGDKMAKEGAIYVELGAWASNFILTIIGLYFLNIALNDSRLFESDFYTVWWERIRRRKIKIVNGEL